MSNPSQNHTVIRLPVERADQLRAIAQAHGLTLVETIERWIAQEIAAGTIPPDLPGVVIRIDPKGKGGMTLREAMLNLDAEEARAMAGRLRQMARNSLKSYQAEFARLSRKGTGIVVTDPEGRKFAASPAIALDLADQIDRALETEKGPA